MFIGQPKFVTSELGCNQHLASQIPALPQISTPHTGPNLSKGELEIVNCKLYMINLAPFCQKLNYIL